MTEVQIAAAVKKRYSSNGYTFLTSVRNGVGFGRARDRTIDALAISTWPSRGLFAEGIEIKSYRSDLRRELENPQKAEDIAQYCAYWWLACGPGVYEESMLIPANWGILEVENDGDARVSKKPTPLTPKPFDILFVCSVLRNFSESYISRADVDEHIRSEIAAGVERHKQQADHRSKELEKAVQGFKESSGIDLMDYEHAAWNLKEIGEAVKLITGLRERPLKAMNSACEQLRAALEAVEKAIGVQ